MKNLEIKRVARIQAHFTAEQWQLYTSEMPVESKDAAQFLNRELERCVNHGYSKEDTSRFVRSVMRSWSDYGADDSEPHLFLESVLDEIYADPDQALQFYLYPK